ncbi:MAG: hypothetical protein AMXMBFR83_25770 [Phycisphaerae bacterium]
METTPLSTIQRADAGARGPTVQLGPGAMAALTAAFVLVGHVWSVPTGLFLDDHAHYANLRGGDWSFRSAVDAARLNIIGGVMDLWGRPATGLSFFRPIAFWIMRAEYTLVGWRPAGMHVWSLAWHYLCALLVGALAMRCFGRRGWATVAACLTAIHPGHMATVYWIACQTELMTTAFLLIGVLAYARAAGWGCSQGVCRPWLALRQPRAVIRADAPPPQVAPADPGVAGFQQAGSVTGRSVGGNGVRRTGLFIVAIACYGLAMGCRENAVLFPAVCWLGDRLCGTVRRRLRWEHLAMLAVGAGYFALRFHMLGGMALPERPYRVMASDPGFARYVVDKTLYYTLGLLAYVPVVPKAGEAFFADRPAVLYGGAAGAAAMLLLVWRAYGFQRAWLWPAAWAGLFIAPVLPVFASSHHLYLPGVGAVLLTTAALAALGGFTRPGGWPLPQWRKAACAALLAALAAGLSLFTWGQGFAFDAGTRLEDMLVKEVISRGPALRDDDHLFFINFPVLAYYAVPAIEAQTGRRNLHGHVLTFSPDLLRMDAPASVEAVDAHTLRLRAPAGSPYFGGIDGRAMLAVVGHEQDVQAGRPIRAGAFTVTPTRLADGGIEELVFTFDKPLDSPACHFYFGSPHFLAYPLSPRCMTPRRASEK